MKSMYFLEFCRSITALLFSIAFFGKLFNVRQFLSSVEHFELISRRTIPLAALLILSGEAATVLALALGGLFLGLVGALILQVRIALLPLRRIEAALAAIRAGRARRLPELDHAGREDGRRRGARRRSTRWPRCARPASA